MCHIEAPTPLNHSCIHEFWFFAVTFYYVNHTATKTKCNYVTVTFEVHVVTKAPFEYSYAKKGRSILLSYKCTQNTDFDKLLISTLIVCFEFISAKKNRWGVTFI